MKQVSYFINLNNNLNYWHTCFAFVASSGFLSSLNRKNLGKRKLMPLLDSILKIKAFFIHLNQKLLCKILHIQVLLCESVILKYRHILLPILVPPQTNDRELGRSRRGNTVSVFPILFYPGFHTVFPDHHPWSLFRFYILSDTLRFRHRSRPTDSRHRRLYVYQCPNNHRSQPNPAYHHILPNSLSWAKGKIHLKNWVYSKNNELKIYL